MDCSFVKDSKSVTLSDGQQKLNRLVKGIDSSCMREHVPLMSATDCPCVNSYGLDGLRDDNDSI